MLLGFPLDFCETDYIQDVVCSFGRVENWINNRGRLTRLIAKVRVADLQSVPQWIVLSNGPNNDLDSWTVQCEIVSHNFVGGGAPPEDPAPHHFDCLPPFDFFGYGQPGAGPVNPAPNQHHCGHPRGLFGQGNHQGQVNQPGAVIEEEIQNQNGIDLNQHQWDLLAVQNEVQNEVADEVNPNAQWDLLAAQNVQNVAQDLWPDQQNHNLGNFQNQNMEIDLNDAPDPDMQEVIINPVAAPEADDGAFLHMNDHLQNDNVEVVELVGQDPGLNLNNPPQIILQQHLNLLQFPHLNHPIEPVIDDEEIPLDMPMDENDFNQDKSEEEEGEVEEPAEQDGLEDLNLDNGACMLQIGRVLLRKDFPSDPSIVQRLNQSDFGNFWLTHFENIPVKVTATWAPLFASMLLSPSNYVWTKNFIEFEAWAFFSNSLKTTLIKIPNSSLAQKLICISEQSSGSTLVPLQIEGQLSTNPARKRNVTT